MLQQLLSCQKITFDLVQIIKRFVPNFFTALNFLCGCFGVYLAFKNLFEAAFLVVLIGAFFDLFDGFFARLLRVESEFGLQFDSLADLITSGLVPSMVMYKLFLEIGIQEMDFSIVLLSNEFTFSFAPFASWSFLIALGAGIRLANYNIDKKQRYEFKGLPAPANALFIVALPLLIDHPIFSNLKPYIANFPALLIVTLISALLMNIRLPLFSFKLVSKRLKDYTYQIILLLAAIPLFYFFEWVAVPLVVVFYVILNILRISLD